MGINRRNLQYISQYNRRRHFKLADDKHITKYILDKNNISCPKTFGIIAKVGEIASVWKQVKDYDHLVIKPANGRGGGGIIILHKRDGKWFKSDSEISEDLIYTHIANIVLGIFSISDQDKAIVEECIFTHPFFTEIYDDGVPDIRIIMLESKPIMAMLRFPTNKSDGKANLHQGGLGIGVDITNGKLLQAYDGKKYLSNHPDSNVIIEGKTIPFWEKIIELSIKTAKAFPLEYLGVDIIIDKLKGPIIMEVNVRPGLGIQLANKQGLLIELQKKERL